MEQNRDFKDKLRAIYFYLINEMLVNKSRNTNKKKNECNIFLIRWRKNVLNHIDEFIFFTL